MISDVNTDADADADADWMNNDHLVSQRKVIAMATWSRQMSTDSETFSLHGRAGAESQKGRVVFRTPGVIQIIN